MKLFAKAWRRRAAVNSIGCIITTLVTSCLSAWPAGPVGPSDRPEAYFNGSSYIRIATPIDVKQLVGLSYRTCVGGELFSQRFEGHTLHVTALYEQVVVSWAWPDGAGEAGLPLETLDNRWHWLALRYTAAPPALHLQLDRHWLLLANASHNAALLTAAHHQPGAVLLVGNLYSGCVREGPQLEFHRETATPHNVVFGSCPLSTDKCKDRKDVLRSPPTDHCYNEPCMRHGTCISRHDRYECHCTARYTGNNCEVDAGPVCARAPCLHGGSCVEDARGEYRCVCPPQYRGRRCESDAALEPQCVSTPCRNNGTCSVSTGASTYHCDCAPGFTGHDCETEIDECATVAEPCLNGGHCVDAHNNYTCDCTGTGYTGDRCGVNVNECEEDPRICNHGVCYDTHGSFVCACRAPYTGEHCETMSGCASNPCGAGGACVEEEGGWRCVCARGYVPPVCAPAPAPASVSTPAPAPAPATDPCVDVTCPPRSHCVPAPHGISTTVIGVSQALCICDTGFFGAPGRAPECVSAETACAAGACLHGGVCTVGDGLGLACSCVGPYHGTCTTCRTRGGSCD